MAERASKKAKQQRRGTAVREPGGEPGEQSSAAYVKALERERDRLKAQLEEAHERIARLEESRAEVVNRIDWVLDSLHNVLEKSA